jgi:DNA-directed RNA polymerase subunit RPC12/RpoP
MVKVISTVPHPSVVKEVVCRNCGATLEYTPKDVQDRFERDYTGDGETKYFIVCPPCGHEVIAKRW